MLYLTLAQPYILMWLSIGGVFAGFVFDAGKFLFVLSKKNIVIGHIVDFVCTILVCAIFFLIVFLVAFGEIRIWQILVFAALFALQRVTLGKIVAKPLDACYNALVRKLQKD